MEERMIKVGITHGDINGISYEVILKTFSDIRMTELCTPILYGSSKIAAYHRKALELPPLNISSIGRAEEAGANRVNLINCINDETKVELAKITESAGEAAFKALETAVADLKRGTIDVLVTAPAPPLIPGSKLPAHTEYLEKTWANGRNKTFPILIDGELRIALATGETPFRKILPEITKENLTDKLTAFYQSLKQDFNIVRPRIAVLSLNPLHNRGINLPENEEETVLIPAMQEAEKKGMMSFGPYAAEKFFGERMYEKFDGMLAMYYDQGMTPFKTLAEKNGLYYTAGLSIVRTSPIHGTAYEIAGQNIASEDSFRQAVYTALDIFRNRQIYKESTRNPLRKQYFDKGAGDENIDLTKDEEADTL
ncbi:MAG: 4-hydroxythreonine-4-phosphate dehydrogenase PdxA [Tannerellaceae bacterium]|jgi:4-hydroxythreonine-4-phosphate dehydrogenase|nr:4-hydroxythreonine-4-phosphate dehydrogenase PdxA [Tannerellaceae bacterium]